LWNKALSRYRLGSMGYFAIGSGAVRGFAVTTGIGIFTSMFTTILVTRLMVTSYYNWKQPKELVV
jgi:preprotein translocase subunit SecD